MGDTFGKSINSTNQNNNVDETNIDKTGGVNFMNNNNILRITHPDVDNDTPKKSLLRLSAISIIKIILNHWVKCLDIQQFPNDIINTIIYKFTYQQIFEYNINIYSQSVFKIVIVGNSCVGKTQLMHRFINNTFDYGVRPTVVGIDWQIKSVEVDDCKINLQIWNTSGHQRWRSMVTACFKGAHGFLLCYDITDINSLNHGIKVWNDLINMNATVGVKKLLVGTRCDRQRYRECMEEDIVRIAKQCRIKYAIQTSAKNNINVKDAFVWMAKSIKDDIDNAPNIPLNGQKHPFCEVPIKDSQYI